jgi:DNA modification methylase
VPRGFNPASQPSLDAFADRIVGHGAVDPAKLRANPLNWRTHTKEQREAILDLLRQVGWVQRVIVNRRTGNLIDGHLRVEEALKRLERKVPVLYVDLTDEEERKVLATLDPVAGMAGIDKERLREVLAGVSTGTPGLERLLAELRGKVEVPEADTGTGAVRERGPTVTRPGDVWTMGRHRLVCGDSTDAATMYATLGGGVLVDAVWTDPPYNVDEKSAAGKIENDHMPDADFRAFLARSFHAMAAAMRPGAAIYVAHSDTGGDAFRRAFMESGFKLAACLIWRKNALVLSRGDYHWQHEPILYGWKPGGKHAWYGGRAKTTVVEFDAPPFVKLDDGSWQIRTDDHVLVVRGKGVTVEAVASTVVFEDRPRASAEHPTMKPVRLVRRMLANSTKRGDRVLDPFSGSGSTLMACESLGLVGHFVELNEAFADSSVRRWEAETGKRARLEGGSTFAEVAAQRADEGA